MANYQGCGSQLGKEDLKQKMLELEQSGEYVAEEKLDGQWAEVKIEAGKVVSITSRSDKSKPYPQLLEYKFPEWLNGSLVGELSYGSSNSRLQKKIAIFYDFLELKVGDKIFSSRVLDVDQRRKVLEELLKDLNGGVELVERRESKFWEFYQEVLKGHGEGLVIKKRRGPETFYQPETRSDHWIKVKKGVEVDMVVMGTVLRDPEKMSELTKRKGLQNAIEHIICGQYRNGVLVEETNVGSMTEQVRIWFTEHQKEAIGKVVTIIGFEQFESGAIRHCSLKMNDDGSFYRDDMKPIDCQFGKIKII